MRKNFYLTMLSEFARLLEEEKQKQERELKAKPGHTWTEDHRHFLYWEDVLPHRRNGRFIPYA